MGRSKVSAEGQFQIDDIILVPELLDPGATSLATVAKMNQFELIQPKSKTEIRIG